MNTRAVVVLLIGLGLAGCAEEAEPDGQPALPVTEDTGCIRGVVVDGAITPVAGATVTIQGTEPQTTGDDGSFSLCDLDPGTYFIDVSKPLYTSAQTSHTVEANVAQPPVVKMQIARIPGLVPFVESVSFDGYYECAFATVFITDSCDFAVRTVHDEGVSAIPRNVQNNVNTHFTPFSEGIVAVVQETWWDASAARTFRSSLQDTPIDNSCDCSTKHMEHKGEGGYLFDRMDEDTPLPKNTSGDQSWPSMDQLEEGLVAIRGFIPFQELTEVDYAINVDFQIITTFFHNFTPAEGWSFETKDDHTLPS